MVHAAPKTQPGGVHGALFNAWYHGPLTASVVAMLPIARAAKLMTTKVRIYLSVLMCIIFNATTYGRFGTQPKLKMQAWQLCSGRLYVYMLLARR